MNELTDIKALSFIPTLRHLDLSNNSISNVSCLKFLVNLESLDLSSNKIDTLDALKSIARRDDGRLALPVLISLNLHNNPIFDLVGYQKFVFDMFPQVEVLDGVSREVYLSSQTGSRRGDRNAIPDNYTLDESSSKRQSLPTSYHQVEVENMKPPVNNISAVPVTTNRINMGQYHQDNTAKDITPMDAHHQQQGDGDPSLYDRSGDDGNENEPAMLNNNTSLHFLEARLDAMKKAVELQESVISGNGLEANSATVVSANDSKSDTNDVLKHAEEFPYLKLLQLWRSKTLECITESTLANKRNDELCEEIESLRDQLSTQKSQHSQIVESWKHRSSASSQELNLLRDEVKSKDEEIKKLNKELQSRSQAFSDQKEGTMEFKLFLDKAARDLEAKSIGALLSTEKAAKKLEVMQRRVVAANERVKFAATLVSQKEIMLRNSVAINRMQQPVATAVLSREEEEGTINSPFSQLGEITPEIEALFRAIFQRLDSDNTGLVCTETLLMCLDDNYKATVHMVEDSESERIEIEDLNEGDEDEGSDYDGDDEDKEEDNDQESLSVLVRQSLGMDRWSSLVKKLKALPIRSELTWGELLLTLLPDPNEKSNDNKPINEVDPLTEIEFDALRHEGVWGDDKWGLIPLNIPLALTMNNSGSSSTLVDKEVQRLMHERHFLMQQIQNMTRSLERRVEMSKAYFEGTSKKAKLREQRLQRQIVDLESEVKNASQRLEDSQESNQETIQSLNSKIDDITVEMQNLEQKLNSKREDEALDADKRIQELQSKLHRLENEHTMVQREVGKKAVSAKAFQRDIIRLQSTLASVSAEKEVIADELKEVNDSLKKSAETHQSELENWEEEKKELLERLNRQELEAKQIESLSTSKTLEQLHANVMGVNTSTHANTVEDNVNENIAPFNVATDSSDMYAAHLDKLLRLAEEAVRND